MKGPGVIPQLTTRGLGSLSLQLQTHGCGKGPIHQPALLSGFGNHGCCFGTLCGDYLGANVIPGQLLSKRTPFGVTCDKAFTHYILFCHQNKYVHIHYIINRIKWLHCFKVNINMLPVDHEALDVTDKSEKNGTWSPTGQPFRALIRTAAYVGIRFLKCM